MGDQSVRSMQSELYQRLSASEQQLASLRDELEHTHRLATLGTLTAGIAHEINNVLTPILSYAQLAKSHPEDRDLQCKANERTIAGIRTIADIITAMLGFAGTTQSQSNEADVAKVFDAAMACIGRDPARDGVRLTTQIPPGLLVAIQPLSLQQVFVNMVLNALHAMSPRGGDLRISAFARPNGSVTITIADTGPGIPHEIADRLFDPFVSTRMKDGKVGVNGCENGAKNGRSEANVGRSREIGGSGLGLTVCKRLVEGAGGTISVASSPGQGATFTVQLAGAGEARVG